VGLLLTHACALRSGGCLELRAVLRACGAAGGDLRSKHPSTMAASVLAVRAIPHQSSGGGALIGANLPSVHHPLARAPTLQMLAWLASSHALVVSRPDGQHAAHIQQVHPARPCTVEATPAPTQRCLLGPGLTVVAWGAAGRGLCVHRPGAVHRGGRQGPASGAPLPARPQSWTLALLAFDAHPACVHPSLLHERGSAAHHTTRPPPHRTAGQLQQSAVSRCALLTLSKQRSAPDLSSQQPPPSSAAC
jgi:hypothetical protein